MYGHTLHEAMKIVLLDSKDRKATTKEISDEVERRGLYLRKDGDSPKASQISARARKYPVMFSVLGSRVELRPQVT